MTDRFASLWLPRSGPRVAVTAIAAALSAAAAMVAAWPFLAAMPQPYPDLIAGFITSSDYPKSAEYRATAWFFVTFMLAWPAATLAVNRLPPRTRVAATTVLPAIPHGLLLGLASYAVAYALVTKSWPWVSLGAGLVLLAVWTALTRVSGPTDRARRAFVALITSLVCGYLSILGVLATLAALTPQWFAGREAAWAAAAFASVGIAAGALMIRRRSMTPDRWRALASGSQVLLPLLILVLAHDAYLHHGVVTRLNIPSATRWGVALIALVGCAHQIRAWRRDRAWTEIPFPGQVIRPASVVWIAAFLAYRVPEYSGFEWDSLHLGELLLPWQQAVTHHLRLFDDFVPIQGGMSLLYGALNALLLDGTVSSFPIALSWMSVIAAAIAAWALCGLVGSAWGLILVPFLPIGYTSIMASYNRLFLVVPILAVLSRPALLARPRRWLAAWAFLSVVAVLYNAIIGLACAAAGTPIAGWMAWRAYRSAAVARAHRPWTARPAVWIPALALGLSVLPALAGQGRFVAENLATNTTAYGFGIWQPGRIPDWFWWPSKLAWETIRIGGWVMGVIALWSLFVHHVARQRRPPPSEPATLAFTATSALFLIGMIPYSLGQVWPDEMSRSGVASMLAIGSLVPTALVLTVGRDPRWVLLMAACIGSLLGVRGAFGEPHPWLLAQRAVATIDAPNTTIRWHGDAALPYMGSGFILPTKLDATRSLDAAMRRVLRDGETYLDLTNHPAFYFTLNRRAPVPYVADYNAPNRDIQQRIIAALERDAPPLAWIGPRTTTFTAAVRAYRVYRWLIERGYRYGRLNGYEFLIRPDRADHLGLPSESAEDRAALRRIMTPDNLGLLPAAWGRTLDGPVQRFRSLPSAATPASIAPSISRGDPTRAWSLDHPIRGADGDFLALRVGCGRDLREPIDAQVWWVSGNAAFAADRSLRFRAVGGELLIPMGIDPEWLRDQAITGLAVRLDRHAIDRCGVIQVDPPRLLRLND